MKLKCYLYIPPERIILLRYLFMEKAVPSSFTFTVQEDRRFLLILLENREELFGKLVKKFF